MPFMEKGTWGWDKGLGFRGLGIQAERRGRSVAGFRLRRLAEGLDFFT